MPKTADDFVFVVGALLYLDRSKSDTVSLPEDRCERLLVKNMGRRMPEGVKKSLSRCRDQNPKGPCPFSALHCVSGVGAYSNGTL